MPKLDIGCGNTITPGYLRADINPKLPALDYICEMDSIPVEDGYFSEVRASHVIEHVPLQRARSALCEWHRVLKPDGFVWIDTPNIERNARLYLRNDWMRDFRNLKPEEQQALLLDGKPDRTLWLNFKVFSSDDPWNIHYWNADPDLLEHLCRKAGFQRTKVLQRDPSVIVQAWKTATPETGRSGSGRRKFFFFGGRTER